VGSRCNILGVRLPLKGADVPLPKPTKPAIFAINGPHYKNPEEAGGRALGNTETRLRHSSRIIRAHEGGK
jgi:hypothetical protein